MPLSPSSGRVSKATEMLELPFFDEEHRAFAAALEGWLERAKVFDDERDADGSCRAWVRALGGAGWLRACVPGIYGGIRADLDARTLCLARERLAQRSALADFAFAMQGLGSGPIALFGSAELKRRHLPRVARANASAPSRSRNARPVPTLQPLQRVRAATATRTS